jgi:hypothetical protein
MASGIRMSAPTRKRLAALKRSPHETYDELVNKLVDLVPLGDEEGTCRDAFRPGLLDARLEIRPEGCPINIDKAPTAFLI